MLPSCVPLTFELTPNTPTAMAIASSKLLELAVKACAMNTGNVNLEARCSSKRTNEPLAQTAPLAELRPAALTKTDDRQVE